LFPSKHLHSARRETSRAGPRTVRALPPESGVPSGIPGGGYLDRADIVGNAETAGGGRSCG
jgi:hypothetical protein